MTVVWKEGGASVTLSGDLAAWATQAMRDATGGAIDLLTATLQPIATNASNEWYGPQGVQKVTGQSGRIEVVSTVDVAKGVVRVSVGSTDTRTAKKGTRFQTQSGEDRQRQGGAPVPAFVHRPFPSKHLAVTARDFVSGQRRGVTRQEFFAVPEERRVGIAKKDWEYLPIKKGDWIIIEEPKRGDGKTLLPIYVNRPAKLAVQGKLTELGAAMAANMGQKNG